MNVQIYECANVVLMYGVMYDAMYGTTYECTNV